MAQEKFKRNLAAIHSTDVVGNRPSGNNIMEGIKMKCPKCQFENREGIKFCEECGAKFELKCPACQASIPAHSKQLGLSAVGGHPVRAPFGQGAEHGARIWCVG